MTVSRSLLSHLRESNSDREYGAIERIGLKPDYCFQQSRLRHSLYLSDEMEDKVSYTCGHKGSNEEAESSVALEVSQESRKKEDFDQQFLEVIVVAIPEVGQSLRRERPAGVAQDRIPRHPGACNVSIAKN